MVPPQPHYQPPPYYPQTRSKSTAYLLWCMSFFGLCGIHRFYLEKRCTGVFWLLTFGGFFVGQFIDLFLIPSMVDDYNRRHYQPWGVPPQPQPSQASSEEPEPLKGQDLMRRILQLASSRQGVLSIPDAIAAIEPADFDDIEAAFQELENRGYALGEVNLDTGTLEYHFAQSNLPPSS